MPPLRVCRKCEKKALNTEDLVNFRLDKNQPYGRQNMCRDCQSVYARNRGRYIKYGITEKAYKALLSSQGNSCAICKTKEPGGRHNTFHIDHCHITNIVRGILCSKCNHALGLLNDNPITIRTAAEYVEFWKEVYHT